MKTKRPTTELEFLEKLDWALNDDEKKTEFDCLDKARAMVDKRIKTLRRLPCRTSTNS